MVNGVKQQVIRIVRGMCTWKTRREADSAYTCRVGKREEEGMSRRELAETGTCVGRCREWCRGSGMTDLVRRRYGPRARKRRSWDVK